MERCLLAALAFLPLSAGAQSLVLLNAHIPNQPQATAIAITDTRITWVGPAAEAGRRFPQSPTLDLGNSTVLPGLIDAHGHLVSLGESLLKLNLKDVPSPQAAAARVRERARTAKSGEWITGWGWDEGAWAANYPTHSLLTEAAPDNPVVLVGLHTFATWVNRKALEAAGIGRDTPDPPNGKILRDAAGNPTGILTDHAQSLVTKLVPALTREQRKQSFILAAQECLRHGLTTVHEAKVTGADIEVLSELHLPLRIYAMLDGADATLIDHWLRQGPRIDPYLTICCIKVFADGALGSRGAALFAPYADAPSTKGVVTTPEEELYRLTRRALESHFQVATHAIGDYANHFVLDAYQRALEETHATDARLRIEHAQVLAPGDIPRFAKLGVIASMQPVHATSDMAWAERRLGPERIRGAYAWRSVLATGAHLPLSSDFPGETLDPFAGMFAAVTRANWYPDQRLTMEETLRGYTYEAAYAAFEEKDKGSIQPGMLADFTVIDRDITRTPPRDLPSTHVLWTIVGGKVVYTAPGR